MKKIQFTPEGSSSISASILSFALTIGGFTQLELSVWWHYILIIFAVVLLYFVLFVLIEYIMLFYEKYIKRANISSNLNEVVFEIESIINIMYELKSVIETSPNDDHKKILIKQIKVFHAKAVAKLAQIKEYSDNPTLKNKFDINSVELFDEYINCCRDIEKIYKNK